jgi:paraquat-inducible protein B
MTDTPPNDPQLNDPQSGTTPEAAQPRPADLVRKPSRAPLWERLSLIWLVPLAALVILLGVAWSTWSDRGVLIEITFADATGINPGETALKFREVTVGHVETVGFSADLSEVVLGVRVNKDVAPYIDDQAQFWLVRPEVSAQGISRLDTVLSGTFIDGYWDAQPTQPQSRFKGLDKAPLSPDPTKGTWVTVVATDAGGLAEGAPVIYRGLPVGRLSNLRLDPAGGGVQADAFIDAPHDKLLTSSTRFWDTSGFSVSLGAGGISLNVRSLASLVQGGVEFATLTSGGTMVEQGHSYQLYPEEQAAKDSIFDSTTGKPVRFALLFDEAARGIARGAKVTFRGVEAGEVTELSIRIDGEGKERKVRQQMVIALSPERLGLAPDADAETVTSFLTDEVAGGLRARISGTGLFGTTLVIELTDLPGAAPAQLDATGPLPMIPTGPAAQNDLAASAQGVFARVNALPIEAVMDSAIRMMNSISTVAESDETKKVPAELNALMSELKTLTQQMNEGQLADRTLKAVDAVMQAADTTYSVMDEVPPVIAELKTLAEHANEIPLGDIGTELDGLLADLRATVASADAEKLPANLSAALEETASLLKELREADAAKNLSTALASAGDAATSIQSAADRLPEVTQRLQALLSRAESLVAAYGERSPFNAEMVNTLSELRRAATSFGALARTIERNPQAFILGR